MGETGGLDPRAGQGGGGGRGQYDVTIARIRLQFGVTGDETVCGAPPTGITDSASGTQAAMVGSNRRQLWYKRKPEST